MKLLLFRSLWGMDQPWEESFPQLKKRGYHGIEMWLPPAKERPRFEALLKKHKLAFIADIFSGGKDLREHLASFEKALAEVKAFGVIPKCVNSHSGSDAWDEADSFRFFEGALALEKKYGLNVLHETNRGRILFHPRPALRMLQRFPTLKLTCDFSHWVLVQESLLDERSPILKACAQHAVHLNARVGYEEGIQVPDPRAPEYQKHLRAHERWWAMIWKAQKARGLKESYLTAEFGPPPYGQAMPYTQEPVADLDEICDWQAMRQAKNFAEKIN
jgi:sugar phosphate isomerase/epimerase